MFVLRTGNMLEEGDEEKEKGSHNCSRYWYNFSLPSQKAPGDYRASSLASLSWKLGFGSWLEGMQGKAYGR